MDKHKMTIRVSEALHRRVKSKAALEGTTITAVVTELLEQWVMDDPSKPKQEEQEN
jgi:predicted DNA binding CopG/RHH family protein